MGIEGVRSPLRPLFPPSDWPQQLHVIPLLGLCDILARTVDTRRVAGPERFLPPCVLGTVAAGVCEVEGVFQGRVAREAVPSPHDDNPTACIPDGPISSQHVVVSRDHKTVAPGGV